MATHPISRDIYIDRGTDYSSEIELSVPFEDYDFSGAIKSSYSSTNAVPIDFAAVDDEPSKAIISVTAENTMLLRRMRGIYDIFATHKISRDVHKEREGTAHYTNSASIEPPTLPPPLGYQVALQDIFDAGTAAAADITDFATASQGVLAETALQPEEFRQSYDSNTSINYIGRAPLGSLENQEAWRITRITITSDGTVDVEEPSPPLKRWDMRDSP